jgi:hypothetical protein
MRDANDRDALKKAFALLDPDQLTKAKKILVDRGVDVRARRRRKRSAKRTTGSRCPASSRSESP